MHIIISSHGKTLENPAASQSGGAGVAAAQFLVNQNVDVAISGRFGPNAYRALKSANIKMLTFDDSFTNIMEVINAYQQNTLKEA